METSKRKFSRQLGRVKSFNQKSGYGFVQWQGRDYWFNHMTILSGVRDQLTPGVLCSFIPYESGGKLLAHRIGIPSVPAPQIETAAANG